MRIGIVPVSGTGNPLPSTRIAVLNMLPFLAAAGHEATFLHDPARDSETPALPDLVARARAQGIDLVWFQKVRGDAAVREATRLREAGIRTVFGVCDLVDAEMAAATDATIAVTPFLRGLYPAALQDRIGVVHDGIERPEVAVAQYDREARRLRATVVTSQRLAWLPALGRLPGFVDATCVGAYAPAGPFAVEAKALYWRLLKLRGVRRRWREIAGSIRPGFRRVPWSMAATYAALLASHVGIIPVDEGDRTDVRGGAPLWATKSENRLTLMMAAGLPVIASPVPAYLDVVREGETGFIARSPGDWAAAFGALRDPDLRETMGRAARASVIGRFSQAEQARRLISLLEAVCDGRAVP